MITSLLQNQFCYIFLHPLQISSHASIFFLFMFLVTLASTDFKSKANDTVPNYYIIVNGVLVGFLLLLFIIAAIIIIKVKLSRRETGRELEGEADKVDPRASSSASGKRNRVSPAQIDSASVKTVSLWDKRQWYKL